MRWLYTLHLRAPGATVILVANKCDGSLVAFEETTESVKRLVSRLLNEWQSRRSANRRNGGDVTVVRLLDDVSRTSCVGYGGVDELVERISKEGATSIQVPPAWDLALEVLDALRVRRDPLHAARAHLGLNETSAEFGETIEEVTNTFTIKKKLPELWHGIVRRVSGEFQSAEDMENALWIR